MFIRWFRFFGLRLVISFGVIALIIIALVVYPRNQALTGISQYSRSVSSAFLAFEQGASQLEALPMPNQIRLGDIDSSKSHSQALQNILPGFNIKFPEQIRPYGVVWEKEDIKNFNNAISNPDFIASFDKLKLTTESTYSLILHQAAVMDTLDSLLGYDPAIDTNSDNPQTVHEKLEATKVGLQKTASDLDTIPGYEDPTIEDIAQLIDKMEEARSKYHQVVGAGRVDGPERQQYVAIVTEAQKQILNNRQEFWRSEVEKKLALTKSALDDFRPFWRQLANF